MRCAIANESSKVWSRPPLGLKVGEGPESESFDPSQPEARVLGMLLGSQNSTGAGSF